MVRRSYYHPKRPAAAGRLQVNRTRHADARIVARNFHNRRRNAYLKGSHQPPRAASPTPLPLPLLQGNRLGIDDLIRYILLLCDVHTVATCRKLCKHYNTELKTLEFLNEYQKIHQGDFHHLYTITHLDAKSAVSSKERDLGKIKLAKHNENGDFLYSQIYSFKKHFSFVSDEGLVGMKELIELLYVCENIIAFKITNQEKICVGLLILNFTNHDASFRLNPHPQFDDRSFDADNLLYFRIVISPLNPNRFLLQYVEAFIDRVIYYEYSFLRNEKQGNPPVGWISREVGLVDHLSDQERNHPLAVALPYHFITFREMHPIYVPIGNEIVPKYFEQIGHPFPRDFIGGVFHCIGSARFMVVLDAIQDNANQEALAFTSICLHKLLPGLDGYEQLESVPVHLYGRRKNRVDNLQVYKVDNYVCFAVTLLKRKASAYIVYCYNTITNTWSRMLNDSFTKASASSKTFLTRLAL